MVDLASKYGIYKRLTVVLKPFSSTQQLLQTHYPPPDVRRLQFGPQSLTSGKAYCVSRYLPAPPKLYCVPASCTPRPGPEWLPALDNLLHCAVQLSPFRHLENSVTADAPSPVEPTSPTGDPESVSIDGCIRKFNDWQLGGRSFDSLGGRKELALRMQMPISHFINFREDLDVISIVSEGFNLARSGLLTQLHERINIIYNQAIHSGKFGNQESRKVLDTAVKFVLENAGINQEFNNLEFPLFEQVGRITGAIEIWKHHPMYQLAIRMLGPHNYLNADNCDLLDTSTEKNYGVCLDRGLFHTELGTFMRELAVDWYRQGIRWTPNSSITAKHRANL
ncbi:hypothetical protein HOY80DRAFT_1106628 [Tuber brumale]|nr:hypothetical protein HOY80DRAFT_1106628 [Tuber brumale]